MEVVKVVLWFNVVLLLFLQRLQNHSFCHLACHQKELQECCFLFFLFFFVFIILPVLPIWAAVPLSPLATIGDPQAAVFQGNGWSQHGCRCVHRESGQKTDVYRSLHLLLFLLHHLSLFHRLLLLLLQRDQGSQKQLFLCDWRRSSVCLNPVILCCLLLLVLLFLNITVHVCSVALYTYAICIHGVLYSVILKSACVLTDIETDALELFIVWRSCVYTLCPPGGSTRISSPHTRTRRGGCLLVESWESWVYYLDTG